MCVYNEEKLIERALKSLKGVVDEIIVMHDGPCRDNTIKIARRYTKKIIVNKKNVGVPGPIIPILLRKAKGPWILKIDADEVLSEEMRNNLRRLAENPLVNGYTFIWPYWNGEKAITKKWPRKPSLYRKSKISYFGFPHWDDPKIGGKIIDTPYTLHHKPLHSCLPTWKIFKEKILGRYARLQAEYTIKPFDSFDRFQYVEKNFPRSIRIRREYPLLSSLPSAILAFFKILFTRGAWKEGYPAFNEACQALIYYPYLGYLIYKLKKTNS